MSGEITKTVLVCGGRDFGHVLPRERPDYEQKLREHGWVICCLESFASDNGFYGPSQDFMLPEGLKIISGAARGVDSIAIDWAIVNWLPYKEYKADWKKHGKSAGYIRNKQMLEEGSPDYVLVFPGGKGTNNMKELAKAANIPVTEYHYYGSG